MLPRWHIFFGAIFSLLIWLAAPEVNKVYLLLTFLSSFLIDFDHYMCAVMKSRRYGLSRAFEYHKKLGKREMRDHKKGIRKKYDFHIFHTIEFHAFIALIGVFWTPFFYIFIGMVFHSLLDVIYMLDKGVLYRREYFFFNWLRSKV